MYRRVLHLEAVVFLNKEFFHLSRLEPRPIKSACLQAHNAQLIFGVEAKLASIALLHVNSQIRSETLPIFFGKNLFRFWFCDTLPECLPFLSSLSEPALMSLKEITLTFHIESDGLHEQTERIEGILQYMAAHVQLRKVKLKLVVKGDQDQLSLSDSFNPDDISMQWVRALDKHKGLQTLEVRVVHYHIIRAINSGCCGENPS